MESAVTLPSIAEDILIRKSKSVVIEDAGSATPSLFSLSFTHTHTHTHTHFLYLALTVKYLASR